MTTLRRLFLVTLTVCGIWVLTRVPWEGRLTFGDASWKLSLGNHPLWSPPAAPPYGEFRRPFDDMPPDVPENALISRVPHVEMVFINALLLLGALGIAFGVPYVFMRGQRRDPVLHTALWLGVGVAGAGAVSVGLWALVGGWGPYQPALSGVLGLTGGLLLAGVMWKVPSASSSAGGLSIPSAMQDAL